MKKLYVALLIGLFTLTRVSGQQDTSFTPHHSKGSSQLVSLDLHLPMGVFARSHIASAGLNYSWSHQRFGDNVVASKWVGFTFTSGADFYFGKRTIPAGYSFRYGSYIYAYALAGIITNPWPVANITLTAGPTLGIYKGNTDFGAGVNLFGSYYIKPNISIGPGITYKKHSDVDALWTGAVRVSYVFKR
jgi:hypothetical protein